MKNSYFSLLIIALFTIAMPLSAQQSPIGESTTAQGVNIIENQPEADLSIVESVVGFAESTGFALLAENWKFLLMLVIACVLLYLAIVKKFEPLLLLPIAFGMLLSNLPGAGLFNAELFEGGHVHWGIFVDKAGLLDYLYLGVKLGIYPCLIFIGVGAMTDFGPLIANPKSNRKQK